MTNQVAATPARPEHSINLLVSDWLLIDATMDNHVNSAIDGAVPSGSEWESPGDARAETGATRPPAVARLGISIRQAGWDQIPGWPHDVEGFRTWPAPGQTATVTLTGVQWRLVVVALRHWAAVAESLSDAEVAARSRAIATALVRRLTERGRSPESP
ncbi:hypothetical protein ACGFIW_25930 [Micromonospora sp. NPDC048935]|uniref:hypothetical protein n=1 Tax=Micromonospora sp. NPDC048935 TaxID=3364262 RepID=UPI0037242C3F